MCSEKDSNDGVLSEWNGLYRIPDWGVTFSISRQDSKYVFRETHPIKREIVIDSSSDATRVVFPWGPRQENHSIKKIDNQLLLCGPDDKPLPGAIINKLI